MKYKQLLKNYEENDRGIIDSVDKLLGDLSEDPKSFNKIKPSDKIHKLTANEVRNIARSNNYAFQQLQKQALRNKEHEMEDELMQIKR